MLPQLYRHQWMDADIEAFRDQLRRYINAELLPHLDGWRKQGYIPREVWRPFGEMGFLLPELPEAYGGAGASLASASGGAPGGDLGLRVSRVSRGAQAGDPGHR